MLLVSLIISTFQGSKSKGSDLGLSIFCHIYSNGLTREDFLLHTILCIPEEGRLSSLSFPILSEINNLSLISIDDLLEAGNKP